GDVALISTVALGEDRQFIGPEAQHAPHALLAFSFSIQRGQVGKEGRTNLLAFAFPAYNGEAPTIIRFMNRVVGGNRGVSQQLGMPPGNDQLKLLLSAKADRACAALAELPLNEIDLDL